MSIVFSDTSTQTGILQQVRKMLRLDATQWPTENVVASTNNWMDMVAGYAIGADRRFQWDDTNHTKLPIGTTNLVLNQAEYSFLTDEQGNSILNLTRIDCLDSNGNWKRLQIIDQNEIPGALDEFNETAGTPVFYDKIADNIIKLYPKPDASITNGLKFYFQRTPSYVVAADTIKAPGVPPILHRGFVIAGAYDGALTLGLQNLSALGVELAKEEKKMVDFFAVRNTDEVIRITSVYRSSR